MKPPMQTRWLVATLLLTLLAFAAGPVVQADGYVIPQNDTSSAIMADQKAVLIYRDGLEDLIISVGLDLQAAQDPGELAWIIPVPSQPEVQVTDDEIFQVLDRLSAPEVVYKTEHRGGPGWGLGAAAPEAAVQVLERKEIGVYDVAVLAGREAGGLLDWLHAEGFPVPDALYSPLDAYIAEGWTFVAMRISPGASPDQVLDAQPVWLSFETGQMVYPMRLTGVGDDPLALRLYILADHRHELEGFAVEFAGQVDVAVQDAALAEVLDREFFLTKLFDRTVTPDQMAVDFYPHQALTDEPFRELMVYTYVSAGPGLGSPGPVCLCGLCWLGGLLLLAFLVIAILFLRRRRRRSVG
jgi:hypothetical protein